MSATRVERWRPHEVTEPPIDGHASDSEVSDHGVVHPEQALSPPDVEQPGERRNVDRERVHVMNQGIGGSQAEHTTSHVQALNGDRRLRELSDHRSWVVPSK